MPKKSKSGRPPKPKRSGMSGHPGRRAKAVAVAKPRTFEEDVHATVAEGDRAGLLELASAMLALADPGYERLVADPLADEGESLAEVVSSFIADGPSLAALALAIAELRGDPVLQARVVGKVAEHGYRLPVWVRDLGTVEVVAARELVNLLRNEHDVALHLRVAGASVTLVALVDLDAGGAVTAAFVNASDPTQFDATLAALPSHQRGTAEPLSSANARTRLERALERESIDTPIEPDSWPRLRPLVEWTLRHLPSGGSDVEPLRWSPPRQTRLVDSFLTSAYAPVPAQVEDGLIAADLVRFRCHEGYGDPLRWSVLGVENVLLDWYPRELLPEPEDLERVPTVLRALIRYAHAEAGVPHQLTEQALAAVDGCEDEYRELAEAALDDELDDLDLDDDDFDEPDLEAFVRDVRRGDDGAAAHRPLL